MDKSAIVLCLLVVAAQCAVLPSGVITCKKSNADFDKCIRAAVKDTIKNLAKGKEELGILSVDPVVVAKIHITGNGGKVDLEQTYTDVKIHGLSDTTGYSDVRIDTEGNNCKIDLEYTPPKIEFVGDLVVKGKLLIFTLGGHGPANITLLNAKIHLTQKCEKITKKGETHLKIVDSTLDINPEKVLYDVKNLVDGQPELSARILDVMNENDMEIFGELKKDYEMALSSVVQAVSNSFFRKLPIDALILP